MKLQASWIVCVAALLVSPLAAPESAKAPVAMRVSPSVSFAPANLVVSATVEVDAANRMLEVSAESINFYRSSAVQLDGDRAPRTTRFEFRDLPSGRYTVRLVVRGEDGKMRGAARQEVDVIDSGGAR
jgi:hypothetical protein